MTITKNNDGTLTIPCELCGTPTTMLGTKRCDRCWELERRITSDLTLATKILDRLHPRQVKSNFHDVQRFHDKFGLDRDRPAAPRLLPPDLLRFRLGFIIEEVAEFARASGALTIAEALDALALNARTCTVAVYEENADLIAAFDGLLDAVVVIVGTADFMGLPWEAGWDAVMERNLAKRRAKPDGSDSKRGSPFDVVKPEGWHGPEYALGLLLGLPMRTPSWVKDEIDADDAAAMHRAAQRRKASDA